MTRHDDPSAPARMPRDTGGIPAPGGRRPGCDAGCRCDAGNPEHR